MNTTLLGVLIALALMAVAGGACAAVWARSAAHKVDDLAAIMLPLLPLLPMANPVGAATAAADPGTAVAADAGPDDHSPTVPMPEPAREEESPETGPSHEAGEFPLYVVPDTLPPSPEAVVVDRRALSHQLGQKTEHHRQLEARKARQVEEIHLKVQPLTEEEAARPSSGDFAMDRPSWEDKTAVYDKAQVHAALGGAVPIAPVAPIARVMPAGAALGRGEGKPRAKADSPALPSASGGPARPRGRA